MSDEFREFHDLTDTPIIIRKSAVVALFIADNDDAHTTLYLAGGHTIVTLETYDDVAEWLMPERERDPPIPTENPYLQAR